MDFWKSAADSVTKAVDFIVDKNRKAAMMNRLKLVIRSEKEAQDHAYAQLGKYYYQNLRDVENGDTEPFCKAIDTAAARLKRAYAKLDELAVPTPAPTCGDAECSGDEYDECCDEEDDAYAGEPADGGVFRTEAAPQDFVPDAAHQEADDDEDDCLRPFTVVPNDSEPEEKHPEE